MYCTYIRNCYFKCCTLCFLQSIQLVLSFNSLLILQIRDNWSNLTPSYLQEPLLRVAKKRFLAPNSWEYFFFFFYQCISCQIVSTVRSCWSCALCVRLYWNPLTRHRMYLCFCTKAIYADKSTGTFHFWKSAILDLVFDYFINKTLYLFRLFIY